MSAKTVFPGMNPLDANQSQFNQSQPFNPNPNFAPATQFPGMQPSPAKMPGSNVPEKQILGFLYSVSRTSYGEFWPLYVGPNTIGRSSQCSVSLSEASVSDNHAMLVIRKMQHQGTNKGIFVFLQDTGSMYGTQLNGETLDFNPKECKNGDVITIGANYELYIMLVDPDSLGLALKPEFTPTNVDPISMGVPMSAVPDKGLFAGSDPKGTSPGTQGYPNTGRKSTMYQK